MRVMWMPYLIIGGMRGVDCVKVGNANVYKDSEEVWKSVIGISRPQFLNIYRMFPPVTLDREGDPVHGTVVIAGDDEWILEYGDEVASILHFLGDSTASGRPAECFQYHFLDINIENHETDKPRDLVRFYSKHGEKIETSDSIILYPPISTRGHSGSYRILLDLDAHINILESFLTNPMDRRIVAIRQYFRTQFSDTFTSTSREDYAGYCSVIESAMNLDTRHMACNKFVDGLMDIYAPNKDDEYRNYFHGLYVARSIYVHGGSIDELKKDGGDDFRKMRYFETRVGNLTALRAISRDLILKSFGSEPVLFEWKDSVSSILAQILLSTAIWQLGSGILTAPMAAKALSSKNTDEFIEIENLQYRLCHHFNWRCVDVEINLNKLKQSLVTCVLFVLQFSHKGDAVYSSAEDLGHICDALDMNRLKDWCRNNEFWANAYIDNFTRLTVIQSVAYQLALFSLN